MMLVKDQWLSAILSKSVYQVDSNYITQLTRYDLPQESSLITAKVAVSKTQDYLHLQHLNFYLVDTNIQLEKISCKNNVPKINLNVRFAIPSDEIAVSQIAGESFKYDRFHSDPQIKKEYADKIKVEWVKNFFRGARGDWMVVAEADEGILGFLQLLQGMDGSLVIDLIAVDENYRNSGVAQELINFAMINCAGRNIIRVGTQIANIPSTSLYIKMGFNLVSAQYIFHCHL